MSALEADAGRRCQASADAIAASLLSSRVGEHLAPERIELRRGSDLDDAAMRMPGRRPPYMLGEP
jgi:hypothetical protein